MGPHFGGFRESMRHVLLLDMAIHTFDAARFLSGEDALAVYCHETNPRGTWYEHGASATAVFEMTNGVTFTYRGSWCAEGLGTGWGADWRIIASVLRDVPHSGL
jgi:predicted dehydrogenase